MRWEVIARCTRSMPFLLALLTCALTLPLVASFSLDVAVLPSPSPVLLSPSLSFIVAVALLACLSRAPSFIAHSGLIRSCGLSLCPRGGFIFASHTYS